MPLGDPGGGNFDYTNEGLPESIFMVAVPCRDLGRGIAFYTEILNMTLLYRREKDAVLRREDVTFLLYSSDRTGRDTGIFIGVKNPYDLHRRLIDEGVTFVKDPTRIPMGVCTSFMDSEGNILHAIERNAKIVP